MKVTLVLHISLFVIIAVFESCFMSGYHTIGGKYFDSYSQDTSYYINRMKKFGQNHKELVVQRGTVLDSLKKYFTYIDAIKQLNDTSILLPTYPIKDYFGLRSWFLKTKDDKIIYELGLFNCGFSNTQNNSCLLSVHYIYIQESNRYKLYNKAKFRNMNSEGKNLKKYYINRFEAEILPLMKPYFEEYKKRKQ